MSAGLDPGTDRDALPLTRTVPLRKPSPLDCASSREPWMGSWGKIIPSANGGEEGGRPRGPCGGREGLGSEDWVGNSENLLNKVKMLFKRLVRLMLRKGVERVRAMTCVDFGGWVPG